MEDVHELIDRWLANPVLVTFESIELPETLRVLDQRIYDAWEHGRDIERQALVSLRERLLSYQETFQHEADRELEKQPVVESSAGQKCFQTLSQAVGFISELLDQNCGTELMAHCAHIRWPNPSEPFYSQNFINQLFPSLQTYHREKDFRIRYQGKRFPQDATRFTLGGHMAELGCTHIDFEKVECGWVLDEIWVCR